MSAPQSLIQAALQRLAARLGGGLLDAAAALSLLAQDAPGRLRQEMQLFWQEVEAEAERIERGEGSEGRQGWPTASGAPAAANCGSDPQTRIDNLRARIAALAQRLDRP
jgi:uncharacterized protein YceH (UPF0502 family)